MKHKLGEKVIVELDGNEVPAIITEVKAEMMYEVKLENGDLRACCHGQIVNEPNP
jgi:hypothetical protein